MRLFPSASLVALALASFSAASLSMVSLPQTAHARQPRPDLPDRMELGRDSRGEPCAAARIWDDPVLSGYFADSFAVTCRGATGGRPLGFVRIIKPSDSAPVESTLQCGAEQDFTVERIGAVKARRCIDTQVGLETIVTRFDQGGRHYIASVIPVAQGPAEEALRMFAGRQAVNNERGRQSKAQVAIDSLAGPQGARADNAVVIDPRTALQQGLRLIRQGLHMEASRILNDTLSRLDDDTPVSLRVDLLLVAGMADSNMRFFDAAAERFAAADQLLARNPDMDGAAVLVAKRKNYAALDLLNRRNFNNAMRALEQLASAEAEPSQPLMNPALVRTLNQRPEDKSDLSGVVSVPDIPTLSQLVIDTQANWARSVALLAQNKPDEAVAALDLADRSFAVLRQEKVEDRQILWLEARLERQRARIAARQGRNIDALAAIDRAIFSLNRAGAEGSGSGPTLAETRIERAAILGRTKADRAEVIAQFDAAVDSLISSDAAGSVLPPMIEQYLDLLVVDATENLDGDAGEKFFRAIQAVGEPAVARQFTQLQSIVTADEALASKVQDRAELEREIIQLRFRIAGAANAPEGQKEDVGALEKQRADAEARLIAIDGELQSNDAFRAVDDSPATVAEIRSMLRPGEAYFKVTEIRNYAFGMLIDGKGYQIYRVPRPMVDLKPLAERVRASIDGGGDKLPVFDVGASYALFTLAAGPVAQRLLSASTIVIDPSGPFEKLPLGVLVTDKASVERFAATRSARPYDYSEVAFLARKVGISSALSPRSFIVARKLPESSAPLPFLGFAEHMPPPTTVGFGAGAISVGSGCMVERAEIARLSNLLSPISARELGRAANALGLESVPEMTGADFTDTAVEARSDLDQFQILHFATHGLTEGQWGCSKSPPALVTSLGGEGSDGLLSFAEIARLRLNANLVVLSACDTASGVSAAEARAAGQEESGATLEGLVRAFLAANARAVLTTYWPISDEGESEALIESFYRAGRTADIATALRTAQTELMGVASYSHPIYWGAFFVVGDASKTMLSGGQPGVDTALAQPQIMTGAAEGRP